MTEIALTCPYFAGFQTLFDFKFWTWIMIAGFHSLTIKYGSNIWDFRHHSFLIFKYFCNHQVLSQNFIVQKTYQFYNKIMWKSTGSLIENSRLQTEIQTSICYHNIVFQLLLGLVVLMKFFLIENHLRFYGCIQVVKKSPFVYLFEFFIPMETSLDRL